MCPPVRLPVRHKPVLYQTAGRIELFVADASVKSSYDVLQGNSCSSKYNFVSDSEFRKFHYGTLIVATCCQLCFVRLDAQCEKLDRL